MLQLILDFHHQIVGFPQVVAALGERHALRFLGVEVTHVVGAFLQLAPHRADPGLLDLAAHDLTYFRTQRADPIRCAWRKEFLE
jgi:hypothetical protein